jgi:hypothetical protein
MFTFLKHSRIALLTFLVVGLTASAFADPPNWKGSANGSTVLNHFYQDGNGDFHRIDDDNFGGKSTHLGQFTGAGSHDLNLTTFAFVGYATWTASDGATLDVVFPFTFEATLSVVGGTGRFANAQGQVDWGGAFSGDGTLVPVPVINVFFFDFAGTMKFD